MTMLPCVHLNAAKGYNATFTVDVSLRAVPGKAGRPVGSALICPHNSAGASQLGGCRAVVPPLPATNKWPGLTMPGCVLVWWVR